MKIQLQMASGKGWVESGWRSDTSLAEVLADEPRAIAARRVDCFSRVVETREQDAMLVQALYE